ncbi:MAG: hypothetical protein KDC88_14575, partial [Ignavibacteriae bacterium]|nr:hypothetical protein [Ignavibacteriota bacterium]
MKFKIKFLFLLLFSLTIYAEDGYDLWLRYKQIDDIKLLEYYRNKVNNIMILGNSETIKIASEELVNGIEGLLGISNLQLNKEILEGTVLIGNYNNHDLINKYITKVETNSIGEEGYLIKTV